MHSSQINARLLLVSAALGLAVLIGLGGCPGSQSDPSADPDSVTAGVTEDGGTTYDPAGEANDDGNGTPGGDGDGTLPPGEGGDGSDSGAPDGDDDAGDSGGGDVAPPSVYNRGVWVAPETPTQILLQGMSPSGQPLDFAIVSPPANGNLSAIEPVDDVSAVVTYTPPDGFLGQAQFSYFATDGNKDSSVATVTVLVAPPVYFELDAYEGAAPLTVTGYAFTMSGDPLPEGEYRWDWGDLVEGGPVQTFGVRAHTYDRPGTYRVGLSVLLVGLAQPIVCMHSHDQQQDQYTSVQVPAHISGYVRKGDGTPLAGVLLATNDGKDAVSGDDGGYVLPVPFCWSGTVTPSLAGFSFAPASISYAQVANDEPDQDFVGSDTTPPGQYPIAGQVRDGSNNPISGVVVSANNGGNSVTTGADGAYTVTVPYNWSGRVTPSKAGWTFSPAYRDYTNVLAAQTGQNYTGTGVTFAISGLVRDGSNNPISGVVVSANNGGNSVTTGADGAYTVTVPYNWSGRVTPSKASCTFSPPYNEYVNVQVAQLGENFTGTLQTLEISGQVTVGGSGLSGVVMNGLLGTPSTNASGNYSATVNYGWSGTATPSKAGYTFSPASRTYTNVTANQMNQDYASTPQSGPAFEASITNGQLPLTVIFSACNVDVGEPIVDYAWDFGDAASAYTATYGTWAGQSINGQYDYGILAAHRFAAPGVYVVTLTLRTQSGGTVAAGPQMITVNASAGTTYYLRSGGNDNLSGLSDASAWATMSKVQTAIAAGSIQAGDRVLFKRGDSWTGHINIGAGCLGTQTQPIILGAYGSGALPNLQADNGNATILFSGLPVGSSVALENLRLYQPSTTGYNLFSYHYSGINHGHIVIRGCDIEGGFNGFYDPMGDSLITEDSMVHGAERQGYKPDIGTVLLRNSRWYDNGTSTSLDHGVYFTDTMLGLVEHCDFDGNSAGGSTTHGSVTNLVQRHNRVHDNNVGISVTAGYSSVESFTNCIIEQNRVYNNTSMGLYLNSCVGGAVRDNLCYGNSPNGQMNISSGSSPDAVTTGLVVANNILYGAGPALVMNIPTADSDLIFKNNVLWSTSAGYCVAATSLVGTFTSDHNILYSPGATYLCMVAGANKTWAQWQALGYDVNGRNENPDLVDATNADFSPVPGGACVGNGVVLLKVYRDFTNTTWTAPSIGAYSP